MPVSWVPGRTRAARREEVAKPGQSCDRYLVGVGVGGWGWGLGSGSGLGLGLGSGLGLGVRVRVGG